ncbi:cyanophycinase [Enhygromyxa salina]|uniref:Cyanophycinase n=1 Tax=Enhygromyxa salina TaxID=215803 RepID=A0A2S9YW49_9BACT|nr:cyanophycinase [Enhygromyxa salina]PRQ09328.1 Cyanophycinase [Enhygromyxa salina]
MSPAKVQDNHRRGYIVPVGGAEDKDSDPVILRRFVEISGDEHARIAVIPTASRLDDTGARYERIFRELGAADALALDYKRREDADNPKWLEYLHGATGVFLTGGNQLRISTILGGTDVARAIRSVNATGVSVGGTSAGAAILSEHMIAFGKSGATPRAGMVSLAPGFGLTNRIVIDQHFRQRDRIGRLLAALAYNPFAVGIGLDEDTAAFIDGDDTLEVFGSGAITVVDASKLEHSSMGSAAHGDTICMTGIRLHILNQGGRFNLHTRAATPPLS